MKIIFIYFNFLLFSFISIIYAKIELEYHSEFLKWTKKYNKFYHHDEFTYRFQIFKNNLDFIDKHNSDKTKTYTVGMNQFGDLTTEEFRSLYLGVKISNKSNNNIKLFKPMEKLELPQNFDWINWDAVTPVKNQGQCGSCWAFSTTGVAEGCHAIQAAKLVSLSEQNLIDCSTAYPNEGCSGGDPRVAMQYIIDNGGIDTESSYPYTGQEGTCHFNPSAVGATLPGYAAVESGNENALLQAVAKAPTSVCICGASDQSFQFYKGGIYNNPSCPNSLNQIDHAMLAIGWGVDNGTPYWLIKNSWGSDWGYYGLVLMMRNDNNQCGIATYATVPVGC
jgi:cathepsin L